MKEPWAEFVDCERRIVAPPHLEARVLAAVRTKAVARRTHHRTVWRAAAAACATLLVVLVWWDGRRSPEARPLAALPIAMTPLPQPVVAQPPPRAAVRASQTRIHPDVIAQHDDLTAVLVMLDAGPPLLTEPVQMVRLRVRRDALQVLGLAVLEPDAAGTVELAVLVGEDGLPRDIRQIRNSQEER